MPGLAAQRNDQLLSNTSSSLYYSLSSNSNGSVSSSNGFWSKQRDDISNNQLQKFWSELSPQARQDLLRIDKQTLFEQARKNMYCSRCNGLLLECFMQIVMYGKSLQHEGADGQLPCDRLGISKDQIHGGQNTASVCQNETQDPSVHPWGGLTTTRDGALTLLDCYSYSKSLKGLQNVFDSACARERERELLYPDACGGGGRGWISPGIASYGRGHGTRETCALHTARLSCDTLVDFWSALGEETRQSLLRMKEEDFIERLMYRFDNKRFCRDCRRNVIHEFKELKELKRMRREPWCTSWFCVADTDFQYEVSNDTIHADWHQTFVDSVGTYHHFEWAVGSGEGKSDILEFEDVGMNGSAQVNGLDLGGLDACYITLRAWKLDGRCTEFSVKAHALKGKHCVHCRLVVGDGYVTITHGESIRRFFEHAEEAEEEEDDDSMDKDVNDLDGECSRPQKHAKSPELAREFLLDAATVIFKEQVEKAFREGTARQNAHSIFVCLALKLLEDCVHVACKEIITLEKQMKLLEEEENEKREEEERKERKRTKEREKKLRRKERLRGKDKKYNESNQTPLPPHPTEEVSSTRLHEEADDIIRDSVRENGDTNVSEPVTPDVVYESSSNDDTPSDSLNNGFDGTDLPLESCLKWSDRRPSMENGAAAYKPKSRYYDEGSENHSKEVDCLSRHSRPNTSKFNTRTSGLRFSQKVQCSNSCGCNQQNNHRAKIDPHPSLSRFSWDTRSVTKLESASDMPKSVHRIKSNKLDYANIRNNCGRPGSKISNYSINSRGRDLHHTKKVWEPVQPRKRYPRSNSDSDVTLRSCNFKTQGTESNKSTLEVCSSEIIDVGLTTSCNLNGTSDFSASCSSSSDNCSSCPSEGDSNTPSPHHLNMESSSNSDSEDSSQSSKYVQNGFSEGLDVGKPRTQITNDAQISSQNAENRKIGTTGIASEKQGVLPSIHNPNITFPFFQGPSTFGYYHQNPIVWSTASGNGYMTYPHPNHFLWTSPFGYGLSGESPFCMQYGPVQHLASPFMYNNQIPVYHQAPGSNCLNPPEQTNADGVKHPLEEYRRENIVRAREGCHPEVALSVGQKPETGNGGFSLFQFGGPVALPTYRSSLQSSDEGKAGDLSCCNVEGGHACSKKETTIEEYNLFAARNGIQFSILEYS